MKSIADILGGLQTLLDIDFNLQDSFEEYLTGDQSTFLATLRVIEDKLPPEAYYQRARTGRPAYYSCRSCGHSSPWPFSGSRQWRI